MKLCDHDAAYIYIYNYIYILCGFFNHARRVFVYIINGLCFVSMFRHLVCLLQELVQILVYHPVTWRGISLLDLGEVLNVWKNQDPLIPRPKYDISPRKPPRIAGNSKIVIGRITMGGMLHLADDNDSPP